MKRLDMKLRRLSPQFSTATKVCGEHEENSAPIANLDEWVLVDVPPYENHQGTWGNVNHVPVIFLSQNCPAAIFQLEDASHDHPTPLSEFNLMQHRQNWM
jgi:hypothetical protein